ncbi:MAG: Hsp70 family protein, partial [Kofleriaceae bacterium]
DDLDERLVDKMVAKFLSENRIDLHTNEVAMMRLRAVAEQTKIELSRRSRAVVRIDEIAYGPKGVPLNLQIEITRDEFVSQVADIIDRTFPVCQESLAIAGLGIKDIADVILVGGTTKIPYVRDQVSKFFAKSPRTDVNPEDAVAVGASLQASSLERILSRPRTSSKIPVQPLLKEDSLLDASDSIDSFTDVVDFPDNDETSGSITMAPDELATGRPKRTTSGYSDIARRANVPSEGAKPDTSYSVTRSGARDTFDDTKTKPAAQDPLDELTRPASYPIDDTTRPDAANPLTAQNADSFSAQAPLPNAQPLARMTRNMPAPPVAGARPAPPPPPAGLPPVGKRTAFGVAPGPQLDPKMTSRVPLQPRPPAASDPFFTPPAALPIVPPRPEAPWIAPDGRPGTANPASTQPLSPSAPIAPPTAPTLVALAPDFAQEVDTANQLAAASTARGMGQARTTTQVGTMPQAPPLPPQGYAALAPVPGRDYSAEPQYAVVPVPVAPPRPAPVLLEVTPRGLGIGTVAGFCEELIRRNARVPAETKKIFTTSRDKQDLVRIVVCQGESRRIENNTVIGDLVLQNLPPRPRGETSIEVTFMLDASGILQVRARDAQTGVEQRASLDLVGGVPQQDIAASRDRLQQLRR